MSVELPTHEEIFLNIFEFEKNKLLIGKIAFRLFLLIPINSMEIGATSDINPRGLRNA